MKIKSSLHAVLGILALSCAGTLFAAETPSKLAGVSQVSPAQAKQLIDSGSELIDVRTANEFAEGHIKGAKLVSYKEKSPKVADFDASLDSFDLSKLPSDKGASIVFYCNGADCWKSYKASSVAVKAGYKRINWLREGFPGWKAKGYAVE